MDHQEEKANEDFFKHYDVISTQPMPVTESVDQEIFGREYMSIRNSRRIEAYEIISDKKLMAKLSLSPDDKLLPENELLNKLSRFKIFEGIIHGNKTALEAQISNDMGVKVILVPIEE